MIRRMRVTRNYPSIHLDQKTIILRQFIVFGTVEVHLMMHTVERIVLIEQLWIQIFEKESSRYNLRQFIAEHFHSFSAQNGAPRRRKAHLEPNLHEPLVDKAGGAEENFLSRCVCFYESAFACSPLLSVADISYGPVELPGEIISQTDFPTLVLVGVRWKSRY